LQVDSANLLGLATVAYVGGTLALHRLRLARKHREGLELHLLRRIDPAPLPAAAQPALESLARAEAARVQNDHAAREREARSALARIHVAGGRRGSSALAYLDAQVRLNHLVGPLNLEVVGLATAFALKRALRRFGPTPELHLGLAHAYALLGQTTAALDELGRAVYYAKGARFEVELVLASAYVEQERPRLRELCLTAG
jgi:hypothetical protein